MRPYKYIRKGSLRVAEVMALRMKKGLKKAAAAVVCIVAAVAVGGGAWQAVVRIKSEKYNLISLDTSSLPEPVGVEKESEVQLSEVNMHYAVYGSGEKSVILIHGNGSSHKRLEELATYLGNDYTVYAPDSRCHGQSSDPGEISYKLMAKDISEFITILGIVKPYIMGHSDGGIIALTLASEYPDLTAGIISCGANSVPSAFKPYFTAFVKINNMIKQDKLNDMMLELPDFTREDFEKITVPTYIVAAEYDIMWLSDTVYIHESIKDSKIAIIKGGNHSSYMTEDGKQGYVLAKMCLDEFCGNA